MDYSRVLKLSGIVGIPLFLIMATLLLYYSAVKPLNIEGRETTHAHISSNEVIENSGYSGERRQIVPRADDAQSRLFIPLDLQVTSEDIYIEDSYATRQLMIQIDGMKADFFDENEMFGQLRGIRTITLWESEENLLILISLDRVYEYEMLLENQKLSLCLMPPGEVYDRIVVLGSSEEGISDEITHKVQQLLEQVGVRVYMMPAEYETDYDEAFVGETDAKLYVEIRTGDSEDYGISAYYNDVYYVDSYTNASFADLLVRRSAESVSNRGIGIYGAPEGDVLGAVRITAARVVVGSVNNDSERELLEREDYQSDLAAGITQAILEALE